MIYAAFGLGAPTIAGGVIDLAQQPGGPAEPSYIAVDPDREKIPPATYISPTPEPPYGGDTLAARTELQNRESGRKTRQPAKRCRRNAS